MTFLFQEKLLQSGNESDVVVHLQRDRIGIGDHLPVDPILHLDHEQSHQRFPADDIGLQTLKLFQSKDQERIHL